MNLVFRNLLFFWRTNLGVMLGAACATAVLVGAMTVGDSVRLSLHEQALARIGKVDAALIAGDRHFRTQLADRIAEDVKGTATAPVLSLQGIAKNPTRDSRAGIVDVFGVDDRFFALSPGASPDAPAPSKAYVNRRLAEQLGVGLGDSILLRIEKPSLLPRDMLMSTIDDISFALPLEVGAILSDGEFGRFSLRASQVPPFNLFVNLKWLQQKLDLADRANLLLLGRDGEASSKGARVQVSGDPGSNGEIATLVENANDSVRDRWTLADAELRVKRVGDLDELTSDRVFIDRPIVDAVRGMGEELIGVLTYFVNDLRHEKQATPYSTVAAIGPLAASPPRQGPPTNPAITDALQFLPTDLGSFGIVINDWLAEDLSAKPGGEITLDFFVMGPQLQLQRASHIFRVRDIVPMRGLAADQSLMPAFPGVADSENCRDWEPGIPIDLDRIRDVDEKYWDDHKGTPKAFIELGAGRRLWGNRYGDLTAIRGPRGFTDRVQEQLPRALDPASLGLYFRDVRGPALAAGTSATDFGGLFLGLSFFLIGAALLLTSLLFVFGVEQRANEIGALLALGFRPARVRWLFLAESLILATVGGVLGAGMGMAYTSGVLLGLGTLWQDAVGATTLALHVRWSTVLLGTAIAIVTAVLAIAIALRKVFDRPAVELLNSRNGIPSSPPPTRAGRNTAALAIACPTLAIALVLIVGGSGAQAAGAFFGAGALLLIGALAACRWLLVRFASGTGEEIESVSALGVRNSGRRGGRSLATVALLASGTFLVVAVQANRLEPPQDATQRESGTGGFSLFGRSTLPVLRDIATPEGREAFGLEEEVLEDVAIVPIRVREGDDASCLNLSISQNPRLVGVSPKSLEERGAFQFVDSLPPITQPDTTRNPWSLLDANYGEDVVPAIGDEASITWALHKKIGDEIEYRDDRGRTFRVRIVGAVKNSILQGNLVIAEDRFRERFPASGGYRMFLIDAPSARVPELSAELTNAFEDIGLELTSTADRLRAFNAVQNTYLLIFQALGGLGLLLGSIGVGMVVMRNALERRSELALITAVGFPLKAVRLLIWSEHGLLLGLGLASGVVAALLAVLPGTGSLTFGMIGLVGAVGASGAIWVLLASAFATRGPILRALQND